MDDADRYIDRVKHLPPAPTVATELLGMFGDPNRDIDRIVELITHDPSLTAEVLRRCNSAFFSAAEPASDMFEAVMRLGFYEVYCVVTAAVGARAMAMAKNQAGLDVGALWRHSVTTAVASATLARRVNEAEPLAFTAGLLHDVGKLVFAAVDGAAYGELVQRGGGSGPVLAEAEDAVLGVNHAAVGARLLARWNLPKSVVQVTRYHHQTPIKATPFDQLAATIHFGNELAHHLVEGRPTLEELPQANLDSMQLLEVMSSNIPEVVEDIQVGMQRVQGLLNMQL